MSGNDLNKLFGNIDNDCDICYNSDEIFVKIASQEMTPVEALKKIADAHPCVDKIELLPFRKICQTKYDNMGLDFPFESFETPSAELMKELEAKL